MKGEIQVAAFDRNWQSVNAFHIDLFESASDSIWSVLPDADLKGAVYTASSKYYRLRYLIRGN